jgi:hypothetical protein
MAESFNTQRYEFLNMNGLKWVSPNGITNNGEGFKASQSIGVTIIGRSETNTDWNYNNGMGRKSPPPKSNKHTNSQYAPTLTPESAQETHPTNREAQWRQSLTHGTATSQTSTPIDASGIGHTLPYKEKEKTKLTYLTVYRINDQTSLKVDLNAMSGGRGQQRANPQQLQILREENKNDILPPHNCFKELRALFKEKFSAEGHEVVMGIDANESTTGTAHARSAD